MAKRLTQAERSEDTRRRLLEAARKVFVQRGFYATTLEQVADAAGFTKGAVYSQFDSKADLFLALLDKRVDQRVEEVRSAGRLASSPEELATVMGHQWMRSARADMGWQVLALEFRLHVARNPQLRERYVAAYARLRDAIAQAMSAEFRSVGLEPTMPLVDIARAILLIGQGSLLGQLAEAEAYSEPLIDRIGTAFLHTLVLEAQSARQARRARSGSKPARRKELA